MAAGAPYHLLSSEQYENDTLFSIFNRASELRKAVANQDTRRGLMQTYLGYQACIFFYEPSTRTKTSFVKALDNLGIGRDVTENAKEFSSAAKGETVEDTVRVLDEYGFDLIIMRHNEDDGLERATAQAVHTPIINAGSGKREHPTQSILDAQTIYEEFGTLSGLHITVGGDLAHGRTVNSLIRLLAKQEGNTFTLVSPPELQLNETTKTRLDEHGADYRETTEVHEAVRDAQVVYWTRAQLERADDPDHVKEIARNFQINTSVLQAMRQDAIIMHPLPRVGEVTDSVDADSRTRYFRQAGNGVYTRMAIIEDSLGQPR